jgi:hypothetical protein
LKYHFIAGFWWLGQALLKMKKTYFFIKNSCKYLIFKSVQLNKGKRYKIVWKKFRCFSSDKPLSLTLNEMKTKDCLKLVRICCLSQLVIGYLNLTGNIIVAYQLCIVFYLGGQQVKYSTDQSKNYSRKQPHTIGKYTYLV